MTRSPSCLARAVHDDCGTSLMELIVGMAIMVVFMGIFTTSMLLMSNTVNKVQAMSTTTAQNTSAFMWLDRKVRYATAISKQSQDTNTTWWHVEFEMTDMTCYQLALVTTKNGATVNQLQQRSWTDTGTSSFSNPTPWTPLASNVVGASSPPFAVGNSSVLSHQQLTVSLKASSAAAGKADSFGTFTFTAMNSSVGPTQPCQQLPVGTST